MTLATLGRGRVQADRGSVTVFVAVAALGLLALAGLVVDGGGKVRALQRADRVAAEAARAAGQAVDRSAVLAGSALRVDRRAALVAAEASLRAAGAQGSARISDDGRAVAVTVRGSEPTVLLGLIGITRFDVTGRAEAVLVDLEGGTQP